MHIHRRVCNPLFPWTTFMLWIFSVYLKKYLKMKFAKIMFYVKTPLFSSLLLNSVYLSPCTNWSVRGKQKKNHFYVIKGRQCFSSGIKTSTFGILFNKYLLTLGHMFCSRIMMIQVLPFRDMYVEMVCTVTLFFFKDFIYLFSQKGREEERKRNINVWLPLTHPLLGTLASNPGMCPDWESNWQPFGLQPALNPLSYTSQGCL